MSGVVALVSAAVLPAAAAAQQTTAAATSLVFERVTVVDVELGKLVPERRVVIVGNRITAMGGTGTRIPKGAQVVDARGKYLIPGLWDMHVHAEAPGSRRMDSVPFMASQRAYAIFLIDGVTGVRDMSYQHPPDSLRRWRRAVAAGIEIGPRVIGGTYRRIGPLGDPFPFGPQPGVSTPANARRIVDSLKSAGVDFFKVHSWNWTHGYSPGDEEARNVRATYFAIAAQARRVGLPLAGHPPQPWAVTLAEASDSGQRSFEHFDTFEGPCWQPDSVGEAQCAALAARFVKNGTWFTPTLRIGIDTANPLRYKPRWYEHYTRITMGPGGNERMSLTNGLWLVRRARRLGLPMLAGADSRASLDYHKTGGTVHRELRWLVEAGLTPVEALRTATLNPAKYFNATDSLGTVAQGKLADLVLLDADPLADITNTTQVHAVVANGRYFDRAALDRVLAEIQAASKP